jgi:CRISPR-associated protein Cas1
VALRGRLGLETARIAHADRHGLIWLDRGNLTVENGCLRFVTAGGYLSAGDYQIPHQAVSLILLGPGSTISHDALRLVARHGCGVAAVGEDGVRCYTAPPLGPDRSDVARRQARVWSDDVTRHEIARRMYAWRLGEILPHRDIEVLRGIEGSRVKESYRLAAQRHGIEWHGRRYDRGRPEAADAPNQAINHAATAVQAAASLAVASLSALPQLGFIHEDSDQAFVLDIADLYREEITLPIAFGAVGDAHRTGETIDRSVRRRAGRIFRERKVVPAMIDRIKLLFEIA